MSRPATFAARLEQTRDLMLHRAMRSLPPSACSAIGAALGVLLGQRGNRTADANASALLCRLHPEWDDAALQAALRRLWRGIGRTFAEFSVLPEISGPDRVTIIGEEVLRAVVADPRPTIVCFPHLGNWEVMGARLSTHPDVAGLRRFIAVVAPPQNPAQAAIAERVRARLPGDLVTHGPGVWRELLERLRQPYGTVWLSADGVEQDGVLFPLFGRPPRSDSGMGKAIRLASATGARILPVYCQRHPGARFSVHVLDPVAFPPGRMSDAQTKIEVQRFDALLGPVVTRFVEDWYMAMELRPWVDLEEDGPQ